MRRDRDLPVYVLALLVGVLIVLAPPVMAWREGALGLLAVFGLPYAIFGCVVVRSALDEIFD